MEKEAGMTGSVRWSKQDRVSDKCTALMLTAAGGYTKCVELLIEKEAKMQDSEGITALMYAAKYDKKECTNLLLDKEKDMKDKDGHNARWHAIGECKEILVKIEPCVCKDLFDAAHYGCEEHCK